VCDCDDDNDYYERIEAQEWEDMRETERLRGILAKERKECAEVLRKECAEVVRNGVDPWTVPAVVEVLAKMARVIAARDTMHYDYLD
jgi:hypothetical protein